MRNPCKGLRNGIQAEVVDKEEDMEVREICLH